MTIVCPSCNGTGQYQGGSCQTCGGSGEYTPIGPVQITKTHVEAATITLADVLDKVNDVLDKCNDILEQVTEP